MKNIRFRSKITDVLLSEHVEINCFKIEIESTHRITSMVVVVVLVV